MLKERNARKQVEETAGKREISAAEVREMGLQTPETSEMLQRLQKVEKQNRWVVGAVVLAVFLGGTALVLRIPRQDRLALVALLVAGAAILLGPGRDLLNKRLGLQKTMEAGSFVLLDPKGRMQGGLCAGEDGPYLFLAGATGDLCLSPGRPGPGQEGPWLFMKGAKGSLGFGVEEEGPNASMNGPEGKGKVELEFTDNEPSITLSDGTGNKRSWSATAKS